MTRLQGQVQTRVLIQIFFRIIKDLIIEQWDVQKHGFQLQMKNRCSQKWLFLAYLFFECRYLTCMSLQTLHHKKSLIGYSQCLMSYSHSATSIDKSTIQRVCNATSYHYMVLMILTIHVKFLITTIEIWVDVKFLTFFIPKHIIGWYYIYITIWM